MTIYYLNTKTGSDANSGLTSFTNAKKTMAAILETIGLVDNDEVRVASGSEIREDRGDWPSLLATVNFTISCYTDDTTKAVAPFKGVTWQQNAGANMFLLGTVGSGPTIFEGIRFKDLTIPFFSVASGALKTFKFSNCEFLNSTKAIMDTTQTQCNGTYDRVVWRGGTYLRTPFNDNVASQGGFMGDISINRCTFYDLTCRDMFRQLTGHAGTLNWIKNCIFQNIVVTNEVVNFQSWGNIECANIEGNVWDVTSITGYPNWLNNANGSNATFAAWVALGFGDQISQNADPLMADPANGLMVAAPSGPCDKKGVGNSVIGERGIGFGISQNANFAAYDTNATKVNVTKVSARFEHDGTVSTKAQWICGELDLGAAYTVNGLNWIGEEEPPASQIDDDIIGENNSQTMKYEFQAGATVPAPTNSYTMGSSISVPNTRYLKVELAPRNDG